MVIENPGFRKWFLIHPPERLKWIRLVSIGDAVIFVCNHSYIEGEIEMINHSGVNVVNNGKYRFVRWSNVKAIKKME